MVTIPNPAAYRVAADACRDRALSLSRDVEMSDAYEQLAEVYETIACWGSMADGLRNLVSDLEQRRGAE